jgi:hypothetical protein
MSKTPSYIQNLLVPTAQTARSRRAWGIELENVWLPFFTATNVMGDTAIPHDALGAPLRLAYNKDGSVRFAKNGRPVIRIAKSISQHVSLVRENFVATLRQYSQSVAESKTKEYGDHVKLAERAGEPIKAKEQADIARAIQIQVEQMAESETEAETEAEREKVPA